MVRLVGCARDRKQKRPWQGQAPTHSVPLGAGKAERERLYTLHKVRGGKNNADLLTKHLDRGKLDKFCKMLGYETMEGVDKLTLKAA